MSIALPKSQPSSDFVRQLLAQQQELTAVEQFSGLHESGQLDGTSATSELPAQAAYYRQLLPATPPAAGQQYAFEVDLDACSGCKACVVACHSLNGLEDNEAWRRVGTVVHEAPAELPVLQHVTTACHHCEDPGCLSGCPVKAYDKDPQTGIVKHLDDQCIGCKYCTMMCPYEVPQYSERLGIVRKCDMCQQRLSVGEAPACVQSCPNQAIKIRIVEQSTVAPEDTSQEVDSPQHAAARLVPGAPLSSLTRPTTVYQSQEREFSTSMAQDESIDRVAESHWPLAVMLVATQISVGMLVCERLFAAAMWIAGEPWSLAVTRWTVTVSLLISGAGLNVAPLHLGQPRRAWRVFLGLRTSWLSREAVVLGKYMGGLSVAAALLWLPLLAGYLPEGIGDWIPAWAVPLTLTATMVLGAAGLYSSAMIYIATRRRLWRMSRTGARFFGTAGVAGAAWTVVVLWGTSQPPVGTIALALLGMLSLAAKLVWEWKIQLGSTPPEDDFDRRCQKLVRRDLSGWARQRLVAGSLGAVLLSSACAIGLWSPAGGCATAVLAALFISGGELAERILYFSSVVYDRMPGTLR